MPTSEQMRLLTSMVHTEPVIRGCIARISNVTLANSITISERFQPISKKLYDELYRHYIRFLKDAVRAVWVCGFVAFVIVRIDNLPVPKVLPLGSFTWCVSPNTAAAKQNKAAGEHAGESKQNNANSAGIGHRVSQVKYKNRGGDLYWYDITLLTNTVRLEDVIIVNHATPHIPLENVLPSPMSTLLNEYIRMQRDDHIISKAIEWNSKKHIVVSETVNLQDQTTSGISLLSEFRNFLLSGEENNANSFIRLRSRKTGKTLNSYNDGVFSWLNDVFDESTETHVLPPNHTSQELQSIPLTDIGAGHLREQFSQLVHEFFGVDVAQGKNSSNFGAGSSSSADAETMSRNQHAEATSLAMFLESVLEKAYTESFNVEHGQVKVRIRPQARLSISTTDDVKKLKESEFLNPAHGKKVRQMFGISKDDEELQERSVSNKDNNGGHKKAKTQ